MQITQEVLNRINLKNKRARKRMARRYMRKVDKRIGLLERYTDLELQLNRIGVLRQWWGTNEKKNKRTFRPRHFSRAASPTGPSAFSLVS